MRVSYKAEKNKQSSSKKEKSSIITEDKDGYQGRPFIRGTIWRIVDSW